MVLGFQKWENTTKVKVPQNTPCIGAVWHQSKVVQSPLADGMEEYACGNRDSRFV